MCPDDRRFGNRMHSYDNRKDSIDLTACRSIKVIETGSEVSNAMCELPSILQNDLCNVGLESAKVTGDRSMFKANPRCRCLKKDRSPRIQKDEVTRLPFAVGRSVGEFWEDAAR